MLSRFLYTSKYIDLVTVQFIQHFDLNQLKYGASVCNIQPSLAYIRYVSCRLNVYAPAWCLLLAKYHEHTTLAHLYEIPIPLE